MLNKIIPGFLMAWLCVAHAGDPQVLGLFKDKVMLQKDGQTFVLGVGQEKYGIKMLSSDSRKCTLEMNGQAKDYTMGSQVSVKLSKSESGSMRIEQDQRGQYRTSGTINGQLVNFIVDTGASMVAMNSNQADQLGIIYKDKPRVNVETAAKQTQGYTVMLDRISLGGIKAYNVQAVVIEGSMPRDVLLGMTFLRQVQMTDENRVLELKQKY